MSEYLVILAAIGIYVCVILFFLLLIAKVDMLECKQVLTRKGKND